MSETLMALMKKGGGSGGSDFLGDNQYIRMTGDVAAAAQGQTNAEIYSYSVGDEIKGTFGGHDQGFIINVKGHTSAEITTGSRYDGAFGYANGVITTLLSATTQSATGTFNIDISSVDYLIFITSGYSGRKIVITN